MVDYNLEGSVNIHINMLWVKIYGLSWKKTSGIIRIKVSRIIITMNYIECQ